MNTFEWTDRCLHRSTYSDGTNWDILWKYL